MTAVIVTVMMTLLELSYAVKADERKHLSVFRIVVSIIICITSQLGLFLSTLGARLEDTLSKNSDCDNAPVYILAFELFINKYYGIYKGFR